MNKLLKLVIYIILILFASSCRKKLSEKPEILFAYRQYQVLLDIKSKLRKVELTNCESEKLINLAEQIAPKDSEIKLFKARRYWLLGKLALAKATIFEALELSPTDTRLLKAYGEHLQESGETQEGQKYCIQAVRLNPIDLAARTCARYP